MAITRKPKPAAQIPAQAVDIDALILRGGSTPKRAATEEKGSVSVLLRVPAALMGSVDAAVKSRVIPTSRHTWLLEALHEKLKREGQTS